MPTWTTQQLQCLEALNIPVLAFVTSSRSARPEVPVVKVEQESVHPVNPEQLPPESVASEVAKGVASEVAKGVALEVTNDKAPTATEGSASAVIAESHSALDIHEARGSSEIAATEKTVGAEATPYFYRLGPWFFKSSKQLPVSGIQWMNDLAAYVDTRLSQTSNVGDALDIDAYIQDPLTAEQKRELWNTLKARLNQ